ncbi:MAG: DUF192 domain-containing protein [Magnetovibrio sp.]|nr:DUF192 domain-containing protein [Magnetovibrio sp.]
MSLLFVRLILLPVGVCFALLTLSVFAYAEIHAAMAADSQSSSLRLQPNFTTAPLSITTQDGKRHDFEVELAITLKEQRHGLMYRKHLPQDRGMLFENRPPKRAIMWMKNTLIPLDMLFIHADGRIVYMAENTKPMSEKLIKSPFMVRYVLELAGGTVARLGLSLGDRVTLE